MDKFFKNTETISFGRFVMDVPVGTRVDMRGRYYGIVVKLGNDTAEFDQLKEKTKRQAERLSGSLMREGLPECPPELCDAKDISEHRLVGYEENQNRDFLILGFHKNDRDLDIEVKLHRFINGKHYVFSADGVGANDYTPLKQALIENSENFLPLKPTETPSRAGFQVEQGVFTYQGKEERDERFTLAFSFAAAKDVSFSMRANIIFKKPQEPSLFERVAQDLPIFQPDMPGFNIIRKDEVDYAGQNGDEIAFHSAHPDFDGSTTQTILFEAPGVVGKPEQPAISIEMTTGNEVNGEPQRSSFTDAEALAFFKRLLETLKVRPGAV